MEVAELLVINPGALSSIQDSGRAGWRRFGVPRSGACDPIFAACANALLNNSPEAAVLEMVLLGAELEVLGSDAWVAFSGNCQIRLLSSKADEQLASWRSQRLPAGSKLRVENLRGYCYMAVAGGLSGRQDFGSRSSYARAGLGAEALVSGSILSTQDAGTEQLARRQSLPFQHQRQAIRVLLNPAAGAYFPSQAIATFLRSAYKVSSQSDRMGLRLSGAPIAAEAQRLSSATVVGSVQVPASGQPMVLLPDAQTTGGYRQIAQVISADLPRLAQAGAGTELRFRPVNLAQARSAWLLLERQWAQWQRAIAEL